MKLSKFIDIRNKKFGNWTVIRIDTKHKSKNTHWICICKCGKTGSIDGSHLRNGNSKSCRKCSEHKHKSKLNSKLYHQIKRNAEKRNIKFNLTKEFLYNLLYKTQECKCAITGVDIKISNTISGHRSNKETTASLDRIDSSKGYTKGNVQWVHKKINIMKNNMKIEELIGWCKLIIKGNK